MFLKITLTMSSGAINRVFVEVNDGSDPSEEAKKLTTHFGEMDCYYGKDSSTDNFFHVNTKHVVFVEVAVTDILGFAKEMLRDRC